MTPIRTRLFYYAAASMLALFAFANSAKAENPSSLYKQGQNFESRQDYEAAYNSYLEAWHGKPADVKYRVAALRARFRAGAAHVHRGQQLRDAGKLQEALAEFERAAAIDPGSFIASQEVQRTRTMLESAKSAATTKAPPRSFIQRKLDRAVAEPVELEPISNQPITLKMTEDSKLIYEMVGKLAGINVLFDLDYTPRKIHVELNAVTLGQALHLIALESKTFWRVVTPTAIYVASDTPSKRKELEENVIKTFYLSNLSQASELQDLVNTLRTLLELNRVTPIPSLGAIVVRATPDQVALAEKVINDLDKGRSEVVVDVAVLQVSRDRIQDIGVALPTSITVANTGGPTTVSTSTTPTPSTSNLLTLDNIGKLTAKDFAITLPSATATLLASDSNTKVIQNPQIRAVDGQKATLKIGDRVPIATGSFQAGVTAGGGGVSPLINTQFQYLDVGVNIDITPYVHGDRSVTLKISLDVSAVTGNVNIGGISQPIIGQRRLEHEIRLKEGEVNLLGGILEDTDVKAVSGYPGLINVPILKYLFSANHSEKHQNEIVFVLTPHIVRTTDVSEANMEALSVGTGSNIELQDRDLVRPTSGMRVAAPPTTSSHPAEKSQGNLLMSVTPPSPDARPPSAMQPQQQAPAVKGSSPTEPAADPSHASSQAAPAPDGALLSFSPSRTTATVGQTFSVDLVVSAQNLSLAPVQLHYDPGKLQLVNVSNGGFLEQGQQVVALSHNDDPTTGTLRITATRPVDSGGASGQGALLTLTFMAKAEGQASLSILRAGLRNPNSQPIPSSGTPALIDIKPAAPAPTPVAGAK